MQIPSITDTLSGINRAADWLGLTFQTKILCIAVAAIGSYVVYKQTTGMIRLTAKVIFYTAVILTIVGLAIFLQRTLPR